MLSFRQFLIEKNLWKAVKKHVRLDYKTYKAEGGKSKLGYVGDKLVTGAFHTAIPYGASKAFGAGSPQTALNMVAGVVGALGPHYTSIKDKKRYLDRMDKKNA